MEQNKTTQKVHLHGCIVFSTSILFLIQLKGLLAAEVINCAADPVALTCYS